MLPKRILICGNDPLGSTRVVIDAEGDTIETRDYAPFGKTVATSGAYDLKHRFTSQPYDDGVELYNYGARMYEPRWGRFVSPDELVEGFDSQGLNGYAYVRNQPTSRVDPDGRVSMGIFVPSDTWNTGGGRWSPSTQGDVNYRLTSKTRMGRKWNFPRGAFADAYAASAGGITDVSDRFKDVPPDPPIKGLGLGAAYPLVLIGVPSLGPVGPVGWAVLGLLAAAALVYHFGPGIVANAPSPEEVDAALKGLEGDGSVETTSTGTRIVDRRDSEDSAREALGKLAEALGLPVAKSQDGEVDLVRIPGFGSIGARPSSDGGEPTVQVDGPRGTPTTKIRFGKF